jgi:hypothetical protein
VNEKTYEKGTIKVVWIENDPVRIYSRMFNDEEKAEDFGKQKEDYVIFSLVKQENMKMFEWKLLPYGKHKTYLRLFKGYRKLKGSVPGLI